MKKLFLSTVLSIVITSATNAQDAMQDVVYMKNDSIIEGIIVEQVPNESIKIETKDGNVFVYKTEEISKFTKETIPQQYRYGDYSGGNPKYNPKHNGYMGIFQFRYGMGANKLYHADLNIINGYKFSPYFYMGVGVGLNHYSIFSGSEDYTLPLFLHLRSDFIKYNVSPFISMSGGTNIFLSGDGRFFEGLTLEPALGVSFRVSDNTCMFLSFSYAKENIKYYILILDNKNNLVYDEKQKLIGSVNFKFGFTF